MDAATKIKSHLRDYLEYGSFPEVVLEGTEKERILKEYSEMILFRDIVERHSLKNIGLARFLLSFFLQNFSREFSVNRLQQPNHNNLGLRRENRNRNKTISSIPLWKWLLKQRSPSDPT